MFPTRSAERALWPFLLVLAALAVLLPVLQVELPPPFGIRATPQRGQIELLVLATLATLALRLPRLRTRGTTFDPTAVAHVCLLLILPPPYPALAALAAAAGQWLVSRERRMSLAEGIVETSRAPVAVATTGLLMASMTAPWRLLHPQGFAAALPSLVLVVVIYFSVAEGLRLAYDVLAGVDTFSEWAPHGATVNLSTLLGAFFSEATVAILAAVVWSFDPLALTLFGLPALAVFAYVRALASEEEAVARAESLQERHEQIALVLDAVQELRLPEKGQRPDRAVMLAPLAEVVQALCCAIGAAVYLPAPVDRRTLTIHLETGDVPPGAAALTLPLPPQNRGLQEIKEGARRLAHLPISTEDGERVQGLIAVVGVSCDLSPQTRAALALIARYATLALVNADRYEMAQRDGLTGLLDQRQYTALLSSTVADALRPDAVHPYASLVLVDLDRFKAVNDTYGHLVGDDVLRGVADALRAAVRAIDHPARQGGDEFAVILPETDTDTALLIAARVHAAIEALSIPTGTPGETLRVGCSLGVASIGRHAGDTAGLVRAADAAAYAAKRHPHIGIGRPEDALLRLPIPVGEAGPTDAAAVPLPLPPVRRALESPVVDTRGVL